jgi:predicted PurR-regulated permease PerM
MLLFSVNYPTPFQKKLCWAALTALAAVAVASVVTGGIFLVIKLVTFLQPILIPVAVAGILAYLLDPVVRFLSDKGKMSRLMATAVVFAIFLAGLAALIAYIGPPAYRQSKELIEKFPAYSQKAQQLVAESSAYLQKLAAPQTAERGTENEGEEVTDLLTGYTEEAIRAGMQWVQDKFPELALMVGNFLGRSLGGFLGVFGLLISMILVPIFLFYFLKDAPSIAEAWSNYLPLRKSPLKTEIVSLLTELNGYLIAFFRGQMLVSLIDGALIAFFLMILGVDYALLIGVLVGILGIIPYAGVTLIWIPAVIISAAQFGDWLHPLLVTVIFLLVNNLDGIFISPRIVGDSVGLHPLTVITSVIAWSIILGGLLGALLAVPLTASLKVVLRRYAWDRAVAKMESSSTGNASP